MKTKLSVDDIDLSFAADWTPKDVEAAILFALGHEEFGKSLLNPQWKAIAEEMVEKGEPFNECVGNCSVSTEAAYYLLAQQKEQDSHTKYVACVLNLGQDEEGKSLTHWFLRERGLPAEEIAKGDRSQIVDPTELQFFGEPVAYAAGKGAGFMTKTPSQRALHLLHQVQELSESQALDLPKACKQMDQRLKREKKNWAEQNSHLFASEDSPSEARQGVAMS